MTLPLLTIFVLILLIIQHHHHPLVVIAQEVVAVEAGAEEEETLLETFQTHTLSNPTIRIYQSKSGMRVMKFGEADYQTHTTDWQQPKDELYHDVDQYIRASVVGVGLVDRIVDYLSNNTSAGASCADAPPQILILGLGGGSMVRFLHGRLPFANITVIELEKGVIEAAKKYFHVKEDPFLHIIHADAERYVLDAPPGLAFDCIFHDACDVDGSIPQLNTREYAQKLKGLLVKDTGVFVVNAVKVNEDSDFVGFLQSMLGVYRQVFPVLIPLCIAEGQTILISVPSSWNTSPLQKELPRILSDKMRVVDPNADDLYLLLLNSTYIPLHAMTDDLAVLTRCAKGNVADAPTAVNLFIKNTLTHAVRVYWDSFPNYAVDCLNEYPIKSHSKRKTLNVQSVVKPGATLALKAYERDLFLAMKVTEDSDESRVEACYTVWGNKVHRWTISTRDDAKP